VKQFGKGPNYFACFRLKGGQRLKRDTNQTRIGQAIEAARLIIEAEFAPVVEQAKFHTWDQSIERLKARLATSGNRPSTLGYYLKCLRLLRGFCEDTNGPADISPGMATTFRDTMMMTINRRKSLPSAHYVAGVIVGLSGIWNKWFIEDMRIVERNPWAAVEPPKTDKLPVRFATDEQIKNFYAWITERFGEWPFAYTGCRLMDLCSLKSAQLRGGRLTFPANLTKGRKERGVPLPEDLFAALDSAKGEVHLWEGYLPGLRATLTVKGWPVHRLNPVFDPHRLYYWVETLFADHRKAFPDQPQLRTHMFRKRAFTLAWEKGIDPRRASIAYGYNVDTLMKHYVSRDELAVKDDVFAKMNDETMG
jgi:integrase